MRRRKEKNPLLMRIIVISVLAHLAILPVLAKLGAFKKIQRQFIVGEVKMVNLPPPQTTKAPEEKKEVKAKPQKPNPVAKKASTTSEHQQRSSHPTNLNQPKVAVATGGGDGDGAGGTVDQGSGKAGELPTPKTGLTEPTVKPDPKPETKPEPKPETKPETKPMPKPDPKPEPRPDPKPAPMPDPNTMPKPAPHVPVFTQVTQTFAPQPTIPDDLRTQALDKTVTVEITVDANGNATAVKLTRSTGNDELDRIAIETARKWKFRPATRDGQPVQSRLLLDIVFQVS